MPPTINPPYMVICTTVIILAILGGVFALAWHGVLNAGDVTAIVGTIIGIAGAGLAVHAGVNAGANAANTIPTALEQPKA